MAICVVSDPLWLDLAKARVADIPFNDRFSSWLQFEDGSFPAPIAWDEYLAQIYGDHMMPQLM